MAFCRVVLVPVDSTDRELASPAHKINVIYIYMYVYIAIVITILLLLSINIQRREAPVQEQAPLADLDSAKAHVQGHLGEAFKASAATRRHFHGRLATIQHHLRPCEWPLASSGHQLVEVGRLGAPQPGRSQHQAAAPHASFERHRGLQELRGAPHEPHGEDFGAPEEPSHLQCSVGGIASLSHAISASMSSLPSAPARSSRSRM